MRNVDRFIILGNSYYSAELYFRSWSFDRRNSHMCFRLVEGW